jgi:cytochrome bd-type quinol oxidase subunit 2
MWPQNYAFSGSNPRESVYLKSKYILRQPSAAEDDMQQNAAKSDKRKSFLSLAISTSLALLSLPLFVGVAFGQRPEGPNDGAACAACGGCGFMMILLPIVFIALSIALLVWVARDAKSRGMDSAVLWMVLVFFTNVIGLIIYIFARPQGNLVQCASCQNKRLQASAKCPHCGNA